MNRVLDDVYMNRNNLNQILEKINKNILTTTHPLYFSFVLMGEKKCFTTMYQKEFLMRVCRKWNIPHTLEELNTHKNKNIENIYISLDEELIRKLKRKEIDYENEGTLIGYPKESVEWFNELDENKTAGEIMNNFLLQMREENLLSEYDILKLINYIEYVPKPCESEVMKALKKAEKRRRKYKYVLSTMNSKTMCNIIKENANLSFNEYKSMNK